MLKQLAALAAFAAAAAWMAPAAGAAGGIPAWLASPGPGVMFGMFVNNRAKGEQREENTDLNELEQQMGRRVVLSLHFQRFNASFPGAPEADDLRNGRIPIESWNCSGSNADIAAGRQDAIVKARADALRDYGHPIFLRYMWEMNLPKKGNGRGGCWDAGTDLADGHFSPEQFIAAWNHMHQIFAAEGATNVIWLWCPTKAATMMKYYPGSSTVDWVGFDAYAYHNEAPSALFRVPYDRLSPLGKPIMIGETGAQPGHQRDFFTSMVQSLKNDFPLVKAVVYFSAPGNVGGWNVQDLDDFKNMVNDPYLQAKPPGR